jgi:hypothetical protein
MSKTNKIVTGMRQAVAYAKSDTSIAVRKTVVTFPTIEGWKEVSQILNNYNQSKD